MLQLYPVKRDVVYSETAIKTDKQVVDIFKRSCYNCHSFETKWPLYSYVFPISVYTAYHVEEARKELNFSTWEELTPIKKSIVAETILEKIEAKEMPLKSYLLLHGEAELSNVDIEVIRRWVKKTLREESLHYNEP